MRKVGEQTPVGIIRSEIIAYDSPYMRVLERVVETPQGKLRSPQYVLDRDEKQFVVIIGFTPDHKVILIREPRYGQLDFFYALPAGAVDSNESPLEAARREFLEETGYTLSTMELVSTQPLIDYPDRVDGGYHFVFVGLHALPTGHSQEGFEVIEVSISDVLRMIAGGTLRISLSIASFYLTLMWLGLVEVTDD